MRVGHLIAVLASVLATCYANTAGTRFHLVFMENIVEAPVDGPLEVHVSNTGSQSASVTVSSPMTDCPEETKNVPANSNVRFDVCWWMRLVAADYWPSYKTVLVESSRPVSVYAFNKEKFSADGYYAIPTNELSYSYVLAAYDEANIATQFAISGLEDTNVQVTLPSDPNIPVQINYKGLVFTNGDTFTMTLTQYETYLGQSRGDLTGARVLASQPIAVFSGNIRNKDSSGSRDHLAAQLQPTGDFGTEFALAPVLRATENFGDVVRVITSRRGNTVTISFSGGNIITEVVDSFFEFLMTATCVITTSSPVEVIQMVRSQVAPRISDVADPAMFLVVSRNQWLNEYISPSLRSEQIVPGPYSRNYAFLAISDGQEGGLRIDANSFSAIWVRINGIASAWVDVGSNSHRFTHNNNRDFTVMVYGASDRESYGFALGADLSNSGCQEVLMMRGDLLDNDCDGSIDEESCNKIDDDGDGLIDEDCEQMSTEAFGNEYVIMFMENNVNDNPNAQSFLEIYLSAVDNTATVNYTITSENGDRTGTIPPNEVAIFTDLPVDLRHIGSGKDTKAIRILATADVVVYGINKQTWSTDGFLAFPVDVVGTDYYTSHYHPGTDLNEFAFTPVYNDGSPTTVTVTMPSNEDGNGNIASSARFGDQTVSAGNSITVDVNYGETAQFQAAGEENNLNGAHIVSNKPISVFSGNVRARVDPTSAQSRDHLVHQLAPVSTWGVEFVTLPIPRETERGDVFFITASVTNTIIVVNIKNIDGSSSSRTETLSGAGDYVRIDVGSTQYGHFSSNRPVQVYQYVKTTGDKINDNADPAMMLIPPVEQWSRNYQFATPRTGQDNGNGGFELFQTFVMIAIDSNQRSGLRLDGIPLLNPTWVDLTATSTGVLYSATVINIIQNVDRHSLTHTDTNVYFEALMYGRADRESYALPLGMRLVAQGCVPTIQTAGDGLDNDCDGSVDEELCNEIDDDIDGAVDEDCGAGVSSGTAFYLTYMDNVVEYPLDLDLELYVAVVGSQDATVTVRAPLVNFPVYNIMTIVAAGDVQAYGISSMLRNTGQGITGNTLYVRATSDVVVYGVNKEKFSSDAFLVYPENSLGTNYYTCSWAPSTLQTEFAIVSTQDDTVVSITLPNNNDLSVEANGRTYSGGDSFQITLARFEVYQAQSDGDLTGTRVQSSMRSAVFSGNVRTLIEMSGSRDHLVQQMLPTPSYGSEFYVVAFPDRTVGDVLRIVARISNTVVRVNGNFIDTLNAGGDFASYQLDSTDRVTITASNPVMVVQFVKSQEGRNNVEQADPAMFIVPSSTNFVSSATFITPVYSGGRVPGADYINYVTLVIRDGQQGNVRFNGDRLTNTNWQTIPNSNMMTYTFTVSSGSSHTITTTSGATFYGRLYGRADRESYAFPVGFQF